VDLVTKVDKEIERLIFSSIRERYPSHQLLGEESASESGLVTELADLPTWIVDPIDGTTNFIHRYMPPMVHWQAERY
jgi:fructose-1,6-bisphosphatase/inositol monophosphatase family enzyme